MIKFSFRLHSLLANNLQLQRRSLAWPIQGQVPVIPQCGGREQLRPGRIEGPRASP
jgi:hypothetical protein